MTSARNRLPGDCWLGGGWPGGGTYLFSEPQPHLRRLTDLSRMGWTPLHHLPDGSLEIAATCTIAQLSRHARDMDVAAAPLFEQCCRAFLASFKIWNMATVGGNLCNALPAGPMISLTAALDGRCLLLAQDGSTRRVPVADFGLGRSGALVIGALDPDDGSFALTVTAATVRPFRLWFPLPPRAAELRAALARTVRDADWFDDIHGLPAWRRHMAFRLAEEMLRELTEHATEHATEHSREEGDIR